jgi:hypothetical protein
MEESGPRVLRDRESTDLGCILPGEFLAWVKMPSESALSDLGRR